MRMMRTLFSGLSALGLLFCHTVAFAIPQMNLTRGVTSVSRDVYDLHMTALYICLFIGVIVFGAMMYALIKFRKSKGAVAVPIHGNSTLEVIWTIIPFIILIALAIPATNVMLDMADVEDSDINIKITGHQWKWHYEYLDEDISFFSMLSTPRAQIEDKEPKGKWYLLEVDKPLVVPIRKKIRFLVTSNDVIHSWWVPAFAVKRDAVPGFIHEAWTRIDKPGIYRGQCAELCGMDHGFMPIVVEAKTQAEYDKWVADQSMGAEAKAKAAADALAKNWTKEELMKEGEALYGSHCAVCHKPDGGGMPPAFPALVGSKLTVGPVKDHIDIVLNGRTGTAMQAFGAQLNDAEIASIVTYERNAWGNDDKAKYGDNSGGIVQPKEVAQARSN